MPPLTWQQVQQPDFGTAFRGYTGATTALNEGFDAINKALTTFQDARANMADRNIINRALAIQDPEALQQALANGTITGVDARFARPDTLKNLNDQLTKTILNAQNKETLRENTWGQDVKQADYGQRELANRYRNIAQIDGQAAADTWLKSDEAAPLRLLSGDTYNKLLGDATGLSVGATNLREGQMQVALTKQAIRLLDPIIKTITDDAQAQAFLDQKNVDPLVRPYLVKMLQEKGFTNIDRPPGSPYMGATSMNTQIGPVVSTGAGMPVVSGAPTQGAGFGYPTAAVAASGGHPVTAALNAAVNPATAGGVAGVPPQMAGGSPLTNIGGVGTPSPVTQKAYHAPDGMVIIPNPDNDPSYEVINQQVANVPLPAGVSRPTEMTGGQFVYDWGKRAREATAGKLKGTDDGTSAIGKYQIVSKTWEKYAPKHWGDDWINRPLSVTDQETIAQDIWHDAIKGGVKGLVATWPSLAKADAPVSPEKLINMSWDDAKKYVAQGESGGSKPTINGDPANVLLATFDRRNAAGMQAIVSNLDAQGKLAAMSTNPVVKEYLGTAPLQLSPQEAAEWLVQKYPNELKDVPINVISDGIAKANAYVSREGGTPNSAQSGLAWLWSQEPISKHWGAGVGRQVIRGVNAVFGNNPGDLPTTALGNGMMPNVKTQAALLKQFMAPETANAAVAVEKQRMGVQNIADAANDVLLARQRVAELAPRARWEPDRWAQPMQEAQALLAEKEAVYAAAQKRQSNAPPVPAPGQRADTLLANAVNGTVSLPVRSIQQQRPLTDTENKQIDDMMENAKAHGATQVSRFGFTMNGVFTPFNLVVETPKPKVEVKEAKTTSKPSPAKIIARHLTLYQQPDGTFK